MCGPGPKGSPLLPKSPATANTCWDSKQGVQLFSLRWNSLLISYQPRQFQRPSHLLKGPSRSLNLVHENQGKQEHLNLRVTQDENVLSSKLYIPPPPIKMSHGVLMSSAQNIVMPPPFEAVVSKYCKSISWSMAVSTL